MFIKHSFLTLTPKNNEFGVYLLYTKKLITKRLSV